MPTNTFIKGNDFSTKIKDNVYLVRSARAMEGIVRHFCTDDTRIVTEPTLFPCLVVVHQQKTDPKPGGFPVEDVTHLTCFHIDELKEIIRLNDWQLSNMLA